jgi:PhnB protein
VTVRLNPYLSFSDNAREAMGEGGTVRVPFEQAPWGATFGMCVDRFGTSWMVNAAAEPG